MGIDNNMRKYFFGKKSSTNWNRKRLENQYLNFKNKHIDIRDFIKLKNLFKEYNNSNDLIIHAAAQPSHDWAAKDPITDYSINANGTLNLLELTRKFSPNAVFIFCSTNKVYDDKPNYLPLIRLNQRKMKLIPSMNITNLPEYGNLWSR